MPPLHEGPPSQAPLPRPAASRVLLGTSASRLLLRVQLPHKALRRPSGVSLNMVLPATVGSTCGAWQPTRRRRSARPAQRRRATWEAVAAVMAPPIPQARLRRGHPLRLPERPLRSATNVTGRQLPPSPQVRPAGEGAPGRLVGSRSIVGDGYSRSRSGSLPHTCGRPAALTWARIRTTRARADPSTSTMTEGALLQAAGRTRGPAMQREITTRPRPSPASSRVLRHSMELQRRSFASRTPAAWTRLAACLRIAFPRRRRFHRPQVLPQHPIITATACSPLGSRWAAKALALAAPRSCFRRTGHSRRLHAHPRTHRRRRAAVHQRRRADLRRPSKALAWAARGAWRKWKGPWRRFHDHRHRHAHHRFSSRPRPPAAPQRRLAQAMTTSAAASPLTWKGPWRRRLHGHRH